MMIRSVDNWELQKVKYYMMSTLGLQELQAHPSPIPANMSLAMAEGPLKK